MPSLSPDLSGASDQEVVAQALEGRGEAYTELVHRYNARIFWNVRDVVGGPPERTVDLVQIAWMKVFGALDTYRPELPFQPWIIQIARNAATDYVRWRPLDSPSLPHNITPSHLDLEPLDWRDPDDTPTPDPDRPDYKRLLKQAFRQLRPQYRRCLQLQIMEGRSHREIAEEMGLPVGTVKSHLHRAKLELMEVFRPKSDASGPHPSHTPA